MIESVMSWFESVMKADSADRLHTLFFRFNQFVSAATCIYVMWILVPLSAEASFEVPFRSAIIQSQVWTVMAIVLAEVGLRFCRRNNILGFWIGLVLILRLSFSLFFLVGIFGLYALLNPASQKQLLGQSPKWLQDALTNMKINFIHSS